MLYRRIGFISPHWLEYPFINQQFISIFVGTFLLRLHNKNDKQSANKKKIDCSKNEFSCRNKDLFNDG